MWKKKKKHTYKVCVFPSILFLCSALSCPLSSFHTLLPSGKASFGGISFGALNGFGPMHVYLKVSVTPHHPFQILFSPSANCSLFLSSHTLLMERDYCQHFVEFAQRKSKHRSTRAGHVKSQAVNYVLKAQLQTFDYANFQSR